MITNGLQSFGISFFEGFPFGSPAFLAGQGEVGTEVEHACAAALSAFEWSLVKEGEELVILADGEGVVLVVVTLGATEGGAQPDGAEGVDAIDDLFVVVLGGIGAGLQVEGRVALEAGGDFLLEGGIGEEIAGELFEGKLVEREVGVEGLNHPVAVGPHGAEFVPLVAFGIGVAGGIEPWAGPAFAEGRRGEEGVDGACPCGIGGIFEKGVDGFDGGRQASQIEAQAAELDGGFGVWVGL